MDYYYKKYEHTPVDAINHAMVRIRGSYALALMFRDYPEEIYAARKDSSMILGVDNGEAYFVSDVPAICAAGVTNSLLSQSRIGDSARDSRR